MGAGALNSELDCGPGPVHVPFSCRGHGWEAPWGREVPDWPDGVRPWGKGPRPSPDRNEDRGLSGNGGLICRGLVCRPERAGPKGAGPADMAHGFSGTEPRPSRRPGPGDGALLMLPRAG